MDGLDLIMFNLTSICIILFYASLVSLLVEHVTGLARFVDELIIIISCFQALFSFTGSDQAS